MREDQASNDGEKDDVISRDLQVLEEVKQERQASEDRRRIRFKLERIQRLIQSETKSARKNNCELTFAYWREMEVRRRRALKALDEGRTEAARVFVESYKPRVFLFQDWNMPATPGNTLKVGMPLFLLGIILTLVGVPILYAVALIGVVPWLAHKLSVQELNPPSWEAPLEDPGPEGWKEP